MASHHNVVSPTLIAREPELMVARENLDRARNGNAHVTLIVGEAGVGKSRLLRATVHAARESGFLILNGASFESDRSIPYAPLLDLFRAFAGSGSSARFAHLFSAAAPELVVLFPELRTALSDVTPSTSVDENGQRALQADLEALWNENNRSTDGTMRVESEYLEVVAVVA